MLAIGPLCGNLGAPLSSMVECQVRDVKALAFELSPSEGSVRLTLQLRGRATDQKGAHMHSRVINRCVLIEDPDWETLVSRQELGPDDDSLQGRWRRGRRGTAAVGDGATGGKEERHPDDKQGRPRLGRDERR